MIYSYHKAKEMQYFWNLFW